MPYILTYHACKLHVDTKGVFEVLLMNVKTKVRDLFHVTIFVRLMFAGVCVLQRMCVVYAQ